MKDLGRAMKEWIGMSWRGTTVSEQPTLVTGAMGNTRSTFAEIASDVGVRHLVVLSQFAAKPDSPVRFLRWHAEVERRVSELGISYTFLRPNLFFQGVLAFAGTIAASSRFFAPIRTTARSTRSPARPRSPTARSQAR
jgi:uncharacterized protein YbjT (DUF2867 family)